MSARVRRRRAALLLSLALASGGLAASLVRDRVEEVEARVGPLVPALVAARDLPAGSRLRAADAAVRQVPERFVPRDAAVSPREVVGGRVAVPIAAGGYLTAGALRGAGGRGGGPALRRGERLVEVAVAGGEALSGQAGPGTRVDVLVSTDGRDGGGRTRLALADVELVSLRAGPPGDPDGGGRSGGGAAESATALAALRVTPAQALYLAAAQNYAREIRLLPRPPGERRRPAAGAVGAGDL